MSKINLSKAQVITLFFSLIVAAIFSTVNIQTAIVSGICSFIFGWAFASNQKVIRYRMGWLWLTITAVTCYVTGSIIFGYLVGTAYILWVNRRR